jgi:hypothetical protein
MIEVSAESAAVLIDALHDAIDLRSQLARACPNQCDEVGAECDDCWPHRDAVESYEHVLDWLLEAWPARRRDQVVHVRGELL